MLISNEAVGDGLGAYMDWYIWYIPRADMVRQGQNLEITPGRPRLCTYTKSWTGVTCPRGSF